MRLLIIEDEQPLADAISYIMKKQGYQIDISLDGHHGLELAFSGIYDVIILDIMLPKLNGLEILQQLRENNITTPILILSAKEDTLTKVKGLDLGADDYLTKPFSTDELLARIRSLYRRKDNVIVEKCLNYYDLSLNLTNYTIECKGSSVILGQKEFQVIEILLRNKNQIISKDILIEKIWGFDSDVEHNNVEVYISFLRKKLAHIHSSVVIKAVRGVGYHLVSNND